MGEMMVYACRRDGDQICYGRPKHGDGSWPLRFMSPGSPPTMTAFALSCATSVALVAGFLCLVAAVPLSVVRAVAGAALPDDLHIRSDGLTLAALTLAASLCGMALWFAFYAALQRAWSLAWILLCPLGGVAILAAVGLWGYVEGEDRAPFYQPRAVGDATRGLISVGFGMIFAPFLAAIPGWIVALYFHRIQSLSCLLELALAVGYSTLIAGRVLVWWTSPVSTITSVFLARLDEAVEQAAAKGQVFAFDRTAPARLWSGDQELDDDELAHLNFRLAFRSVHAGDAAPSRSAASSPPRSSKPLTRSDTLTAGVSFRPRPWLAPPKEAGRLTWLRRATWLRRTGGCSGSTSKTWAAPPHITQRRSGSRTFSWWDCRSWSWWAWPLFRWWSTSGSLRPALWSPPERRFPPCSCLCSRQGSGSGRSPGLAPATAAWSPTPRPTESVSKAARDPSGFVDPSGGWAATPPFSLLAG